MTSSHDVSASPVFSTPVISLFTAIGFLHSENDLSPVVVQPSPGPLHTTSRNSVPAERNHSHCNSRTETKPAVAHMDALKHATRTKATITAQDPALRNNDCPVGLTNPCGRGWDAVGVAVCLFAVCLFGVNSLRRYTQAAWFSWRTNHSCERTARQRKSQQRCSSQRAQDYTTAQPSPVVNISVCLR